jgi:hypothetical protein
MDMLNRVAKLIAQAEGAATQAEAEAFAEKAQLLATTHQIDVAEARAHSAKKEQREQPEMRTITIGSSGTKGLKYFVALFLSIAQNNGVKCNIRQDSTAIIAFGMPSDIDLVSMLYGSLVSQMVASANVWLATGEYKNELGSYDWDNARRKPLDARVARGSFYVGFDLAIATRLATARQKATDVVRSDGKTGEIVLRNKSLEVRDFYNSKSNARGSYRPNGSRGYSASATSAGSSAGSKATMGSRAAIANRSAIS